MDVARYVHTVHIKKVTPYKIKPKKDTKIMKAISLLFTTIITLLFSSCTTQQAQSGPTAEQTLARAGLTPAQIEFFDTYMSGKTGLVPGDSIPVRYDTWEFAGPTYPSATWKKNGIPSPSAPIHIQQQAWADTRPNPLAPVALKWERVGSGELYSPTQKEIERKLAMAGYTGRGPSYAFALTQGAPTVKSD